MSTPMDRFEQMRVFAALIDAGSFVGASVALTLSKAALSRHVAELESRLGAGWACGDCSARRASYR